MREYETIYVLKPDLPSDTVKGLQDKLSAIIQKQEGHVLAHADWGKRKLAYRVDKFRQAQYIYLQYLDQGPAVAELERILKYDDKVLKFLTVKLKDKVDVKERLSAPPTTPPPPEEIAEERPSEGYGRDRYSGDYRRFDRQGDDSRMGGGREEIPEAEEVSDSIE
jgi:small subunit ribosomal protein S6